MAEQPRRVAPASTMASAVAVSRMPPLAFTPSRPPTAARHPAPPPRRWRRRPGGTRSTSSRSRRPRPRRPGRQHSSSSSSRRGRLHDHLEQHRRRRRRPHRGEVGLDRRPSRPASHAAEVDHHVELGGARLDGHAAASMGLHRRLVGAAREADRRRRSPMPPPRSGTAAAGDGDTHTAATPSSHGLGAERGDLVGGGLRPQQRVVDQPGEGGRGPSPAIMPGWT